jgi:hypothetical protein
VTIYQKGLFMRIIKPTFKAGDTDKKIHKTFVELTYEYAAKDVEFLYNCFRKVALGDSTIDDIEYSKVISVVEKYGFKIDDDGYLERKD